MATNPNAAAASARTFTTTVSIGDIVSVNGQPAKGTMTTTTRTTNLMQTPNSGEAIGDIIRSDITNQVFEILSADGLPIGTIMGVGVGGGSAPPGATTAITQGNIAIVGGTGAFLGARGNLGQLVKAETTATRTASSVEDPANRRKNGGGRNFYVAQIIPMIRPEIGATASGVSVFHADFSAVNAAKPARSGENLIARATGLGPTRPGINPGQPFPSDMLQEVNSPVEVLLNGQTAEAINKVGWPGTWDAYRVDFRVPEGTPAGMAVIQLSVAWIAGPEVRIPIQ